MPLSMLTPGQEGIIRKITGRDAVRAHLERLGFVADTPVKVVSTLGGNLILQVRDSRVALDKEMTRRILV